MAVEDPDPQVAGRGIGTPARRGHRRRRRAGRRSRRRDRWRRTSITGARAGPCASQDRYRASTGASPRPTDRPGGSPAPPPEPMHTGCGPTRRRSSSAPAPRSRTAVVDRRVTSTRPSSGAAAGPARRPRPRPCRRTVVRRRPLAPTLVITTEAAPPARSTRGGGGREGRDSAAGGRDGVDLEAALDLLGRAGCAPSHGRGRREAPWRAARERAGRPGRRLRRAQVLGPGAARRFPLPTLTRSRTPALAARVGPPARRRRPSRIGRCDEGG